MKKLLCGLLTLVLCLSALFPLPAAAATLASSDLFSEAAVVIDSAAGQVIFDKNANKRMYPASITKILTVAMALEKADGDLSGEITLNDQAIFDKQWMDRSSTHIALDVGEIITVEQALYATMVQSANDAANALGLYVSGDLQDFVDLMNAKCREIGAVNTHFTNANGLPDDNHYTTAYDMALITRWALSVEGFDTFFGAYQYTMEPTNKQPESRRMGTDHMMFVTSKYTYEGAWGGKLGWTKAAKHTGVTVAERDGLELICVVLKSSNTYDKFKDMIALFDYAYENYEMIRLPAQLFSDFSVPVMAGSKKVALLEITRDQNIRIAVPKTLGEEQLSLAYNVPTRYEENGPMTPTVSISYKVSDRKTVEVGSFPLDYTLVQATVAPSQPKVSVWTSIWPALKVTLLILGVLLVLGIVVIFVIRAVNLHRRERRRQQRMEEARRRAAERSMRRR